MTQLFTLLLALAGIPLFVVIPAGKPDEPVVLPEVITESMLLDALKAAGPST